MYLACCEILRRKLLHQAPQPFGSLATDKYHAANQPEIGRLSLRQAALVNIYAMSLLLFQCSHCYGTRVFPEMSCIQ